MGKRIRIGLETAENGGMILYPIPEAPPAARAGEIRGHPPIYIVTKVDAKSIGETLLVIMASASLNPTDVEIDDIDF